MKKLSLLLILILFLNGCAAHSRMIRLRDRDENVLTVQVPGTIPEVKERIRQIAKEMKLIEIAGIEKENFMFIRSNYLTYATTGIFLGAIFGPMVTKHTKLGFFFDYNIEDNFTTVTITEEVSSMVEPSRFIIAKRLEKEQ